MRNIDQDGFSNKKNRDWKKSSLLEKQREAWIVHTNRALELAGVDLNLHYRTLEEKSINRIPQIHSGANVNAMMKRAIAIEKGEWYLAMREVLTNSITEVNKALFETEKEIEGYRIYVQAQLVLNNLGKTGRNGESYFLGQNYQIERLGTTITISHLISAEPLFIATYHHPGGK